MPVDAGMHDPPSRLLRDAMRDELKRTEGSD